MGTGIELSKSLLREKLLANTTGTGDFETAIDGVRLHRRDELGELENCIYKPLATVVVQGFKRSVIGSDEYRYGEGHCLISGVDMPSANYITDASPEKPFLGMSIYLDRGLIRQLAMEAPSSVFAEGQNDKGVSIADVEEDVLNAFLRLAELLEKPDHRGVLAPMILREIHFCLLIGKQGGFLRQLNTPDSHGSQIARAVAWLRENYKEPLQVDELARRVNMSTATLHRHFKRVTTLSPLQFQKRLRLYEAQRLMLTESNDANSASLAVGYESPHQFNREYKRLFGLPPFKDVSSKRSVVQV
jgi:AraC-type DNA-binding domain-containing proteins